MKFIEYPKNEGSFFELIERKRKSLLAPYAKKSNPKYLEEKQLKQSDQPFR